MVRAAAAPKHQRVRSSIDLESRRALAGAGFLAPSLLVLLGFLAFPVVYAIATSFTRYDLVSSPEFVGLQNYQSLFADPRFWSSARVTFAFVALAGLPLLVIALGVALLLEQRLSGSAFFRAAIFVPVVIPEVAAAVVWRFIFHPYGLLNNLIASTGLSQTDIAWLLSPRVVLWAFVILAIWKQFGYFVVIFATGLSAIAAEYTEAAIMDGASALQRFWHVTLPMLRPTMFFAVTIMLVVLLNTFAPFYLMTNGGPANASEVMALLMYKIGFEYLDFGRATAVAVLMMAVIGGISVIQFFVFRQQPAKSV